MDEKDDADEVQTSRQNEQDEDAIVLVGRPDLGYALPVGRGEGVASKPSAYGKKGCKRQNARVRSECLETSVTATRSAVRDLPRGGRGRSIHPVKTAHITDSILPNVNTCSG